MRSWRGRQIETFINFLNKMKQDTSKAFKLGAFVITGLGFLVFILYIIGKKQDMFSHTFPVKARFENVHGLRKGNNVRFAGIEAGTVRKVAVLNDTTIEVTLDIRSMMRDYIHSNAVATIGTDGLMGNPIINIRPVKQPAPLVAAGDVLMGINLPETGDMLQVLNKTNNDIASIATEVKMSMKRFNNSKVLWTLLEDADLPYTVRTSLNNIKGAAGNLNDITVSLQRVVEQLEQGKGVAGLLLHDTAVARNLTHAIESINTASRNADTLVYRLNGLVYNIRDEVENGKGTVHTILKSEEVALQLKQILDNVTEGTRSFNESMEALQHNFLLRAYFKKQKKQHANQQESGIGY